jgi:hypothetical protein
MLGDPFDDGTTITTRRLTLVPLQVKDAEDMAGVLRDERLHKFIGGQPATIAGLRDRYARLAAGSPDPNEVWLNCIVRRRPDAQAIVRVPETRFGPWERALAGSPGVHLMLLLVVSAPPRSGCVALPVGRCERGRDTRLASRTHGARPADGAAKLPSG